MNLTEIIRAAFLNHDSRNKVFKEVQLNVGCSRYMTKSLVFTFLYRATEEHLQSILKTEE